MIVLTYVFWFLVVLSIVVFIHEFGHYIVARLCGVKVETFSLGFGKEIWGRTDSKGTRWKVSLVPLGGYVKMFGDADAASTPDLIASQNWTDDQKKQAFVTQSVGKRIAVVVAGPMFNYLSAVIIMCAVFWLYGKTYTSTEIASVMQDSPAGIAGIVPGDRITALNAEKVDSFERVRQIVAISGLDELSIEVTRGNDIIIFKVKPEIKVLTDSSGNTLEMPILGVASQEYEVKKLGLWDALVIALEDSYRLTSSMLQGLKQVLLGQRSFEQMGGPVKIAQYSGESAKGGVLSFLWFIVIISLNLALMNLLPLPMLDGGHIFYYTIELITGRAVSHAIQAAAAKVSIVILLSLMLIITYYDVIGIINR